MPLLVSPSVFSQYGKASKYFKRTAPWSQIRHAYLASYMNATFRLMIISTAESFRKRALIAWNMLKRNFSVSKGKKERRCLFHILFIQHYANEKYLNADLKRILFLRPMATAVAEMWQGSLVSQTSYFLCHLGCLLEHV